MITRISIENFKGIGDRITVPIRPLTLLFGPNSAGKSSIMHAIHYAREVLERHNLDADRTIAGGSAVDLGGFRELVHRHDARRPVKLRFDLDLSQVKFHERFPVPEYLLKVGDRQIDVSDIGLDVMDGWVEFTISLLDTPAHPYPLVVAYEVGLNGQELARVVFAQVEGAGRATEGNPDPVVAWLQYLDLEHPAIKWPDSIAAQTGSAGPLDALWPKLQAPIAWLYFRESGYETLPKSDGLAWLAERRKDPDFIVLNYREPAGFEERSLRCVPLDDDGMPCQLWIGRQSESSKLTAQSFQFSRSDGWTDEKAAEFVRTAGRELTAGAGTVQGVFLAGGTDAMPPWDRPLKMQVTASSAFVDWPEEDPEAQEIVELLLTRLIAGPGHVLRDHLAGFRYVGPIRELPSVDHAPPRYHDPSRWADGLAAWDLFASPDQDELVAAVTDWLWNEDRLNTGCQVVVTPVREIGKDFQEEMLRLEWDGESPSARMKEVLADLDRTPVRRRVRVRDVEKNVDLPPQSVGVGLSQVIPVIAAVVADGAAVVQVEQPELHLHPTQQAAVGDLLIAGIRAGDRKQLLIETHSEHLILRILRRIRQTQKGQNPSGVEVRPNDIAVLYVEPRDGQTALFEIGVGDDGELLQPWPDKFFDQDYEERYG